jgi:hypothetical protein
MSCIITYKGKKYSEEQFKEYLINNKQEFATSIAKNKDVTDSFKRKMEGIDYVFSQSPELASVGSKAQYLQYLSTIFPNSKVKDIVYHGTKYRAKLYNGRPLVWFNDINDNEAYFIYEDTYDIKNKIRLSYEDYEKLPQYRFEKFKKKEHRYAGGDTFLGTGIYFTTSKEDANKGYNREGLYSVIIDVKNPYTENKGYSNSRSGKGSQELIDKGYDSVTEKINNGQEYNVFEPEQIHILSSKADIQGFKDFVQGKQFQKLTAEEKAKTIEQVTKEHRSIVALKDLSAKLAHRIGGKVEFENRTDADWKGYNQGMTSVLNEAYMTLDTPFHEIAFHPIIRALKSISSQKESVTLQQMVDNQEIEKICN